MNFYFTYESCDTLRSFTLFLLVDLETESGTQRKIRNIDLK